MAGLDAAEAGSIQVDDQDISRWNDHQRTLFRRERCGIIFQQRGLIPTLTLRENILFRPSLLAGSAIDWQQRCNEMLDRVGIAHRADAFPDQCSGGEQQRAAIAAALIHHPPLVLADEPTGSLDADNAQQVLELFLDIQQTLGATLIIVTHSDRVAQQMDRIWTIDHGKLHEQMREKNSTMSDLIARSARRHWARHPWLLLLTITGIMLGVALVVSVQLANQAARSSFEHSVETLSGATTHRITGPGGRLAEEVFADISQQFPFLSFAPIISGSIRVGPIDAQQRLAVLGIEPFAESSLRPSFGIGGLGGDLELDEFINGRAGQDVALISAETAERLQLTAGEELAIRAGGQQHTVIIGAVIDPPGERVQLALRDILLCDIGVAQRMLGQPGYIQRIDVRIEDEATVQQLTAALPPSARVVSVQEAAGVLDELAGAFQLNLLALGLLSMLVGVLLIIGVINFLAVQRREYFALLRALGVERRRIVGSLVWEALALGAIGATLGVVLGIFLASFLTQAVTATINDLYTRVVVSELYLDWQLFAQIWLLAVAMSALATVPALIELLQATGQQGRSRSALEQRVAGTSRTLAFAAIPVVTIGTILLWMLPGMVAGWVGTVIIIAAGLCMVPTVLFASAHGFRAVCGAVCGAALKPGWAMAIGGITRYGSRTGLAAAALMLALATGVGVGIMVGSFRQTVVNWLELTLQADVYIGPADQRLADQPALMPPAAYQTIMALSAQYDADTVGSSDASVVIADIERAVSILAIPDGVDYVLPLRIGPESLWETFAQRGCVITDVLHAQTDLGIGDVIEFPQGSVPIVGILQDYTPDNGRIYMHEQVYARVAAVPPPGGVALLFDDNTDRQALMAAINQETAAYDLDITYNEELRSASIAVFDRTFAVTSIIQILTTAVGALAMATAALSLRLERRGEMAIIRAHGATRQEVANIQRGTLVFLGAWAGIISAPVGYGLSWLLAGIINRRSFGWTLGVEVQWMPMVFAIILGVAVAVLVSFIPTERRSRPLFGICKESSHAHDYSIRHSYGIVFRSA